jgi:hypothetical protein
MHRRNFAKVFTIAGFVLGEIYMLFTVLAPYRTGAAIPTSALIWKTATSAIFFGPFGAALGLGIGLLLAGLLRRDK